MGMLGGSPQLRPEVQAKEGISLGKRSLPPRPGGAPHTTQAWRGQAAANLSPALQPAPKKIRLHLKIVKPPFAVGG